MKPLREEQVNLMNVLLEGRIAGLVVRHVIGGTKSFPGIQRNLRRLAIGFASGLGAAGDCGMLLECAIVVLLVGQEQFRQMLTAQDIEDESCENQRGDDSGYVKNAAEALPSGSLGVKEYLSIGH